MLKTELSSNGASQALPNRVSKQVFLVLGGTLLLSLSSYIAIPMVPVPITMQTLAVTAIGALYGWRLGGLTVLAWLAQGAMGLPVFANGAGGIAHLMGPTAGYLLAFPLAATVTGWLFERGWNNQRKPLAFAAMLLGNFICLALGTVWLAGAIGIETALAVGFAPFLLGAIIKSGMGVIVVHLFALGRNRLDR